MLRCGAGPVLRSTYVGVFPLRCTTSASLRCVRPCTTPTRASGDALAAGSINGAGEAHMSDVILETRNLTKEFKGFTAVSKVDLSVRRSEERRVGKSVDLGGRRIIKKKK